MNGNTAALNARADVLCERLRLGELMAEHEGHKEGETVTVGERGGKLSGGERQRVGIIRVLLRNPTVLVLDEATSALDHTTEKAVQALLTEGRHQRTEVLIAHRLSTIQDAAEILVLCNGEIVERGTHTELLEIDDGEYVTLMKAQSS